MKINGLKLLLKKYQTEENLTLSEIAKKIGVSDKTLFTIIDTENVPKTETFYRLAKLLNFDISIIDGVKNDVREKNFNYSNGVGVNFQSISVGEVAALRQRIEDLEKRLQDKELIIELLKNK